MTFAASILQPQPVFDSFFFASVSDDDNGMGVSVLSAFARLDFDPWQKAEEFSRMTTGPARTKLAAMIVALPGTSAANLQAETIAVRLIALLPGQGPRAMASPESHPAHRRQQPIRAPP